MKRQITMAKTLAAAVAFLLAGLLPFAGSAQVVATSGSAVEAACFRSI